MSNDSYFRSIQLSKEKWETGSTPLIDCLHSCQKDKNDDDGDGVDDVNAAAAAAAAIANAATDADVDADVWINVVVQLLYAI